MTQYSDIQFTQDHVVSDDGRVVFACSTDHEAWPWLALHPFDPIVVQSINFWASVETGKARGTFDTSKWSALTQTEWLCGDQDVSHATHGIASAFGEDGTGRYALSFFDKDDRLVYKMSGKGVVFQNRDFESWRQKEKTKIAPPSISDFQYADAKKVGVSSQLESFIAPLVQGDVLAAEALITKENGFIPQHPSHSGSGDHVNANHLADVARQFLCQHIGKAPIIITSGEMEFHRYVELGRPFHIHLAGEDSARETVSMTVHQADHLCATITMRYWTA